MNNDLFDTFSKDMWKLPGVNRRAGVLAPLFYVYSKRSVGIGDIADLKAVIDWCASCGFSILQLLPMNEVGSTNCPYDSISSFALEPSYIALDDITDKPHIKLGKAIDTLRKKFPARSTNVDYRIKSGKIKLLKKIYNEGAGAKSDGLKKFEESARFWLRDFILFKALKTAHGGKPWYEWSDKFKYRDEKALDEFIKAYKRDIDFEIWVQWKLYEQFREVKKYAGSKGVLLKGDLPILVSRDSADVWAHTKYFKLEYAAGAPPDMYCSRGQRWGMPIQDWEALSKDDYPYLKWKLGYAENFYDILRIDHVAGLFRIWSIPSGNPLEEGGLNGVFDPKDEGKWDKQGREILNVILKSTKMLLCAEDLGVIPKVCTEALKEFGIPGSDVQRWVKDWNVRHDFLGSDENRVASVTMLSTHDTTNWPAWWENEAGTIDEGCFLHKCLDRGIDYFEVRDELFDNSRSRHGRLRWRDDIDSVDALLCVLGLEKDRVMDFIEMYQNTFGEKERLWAMLKMDGEMEERSSKELVKAILDMNLKTRSIFSIQVMSDLFFIENMVKADPYSLRINTPGTVSEKNWSLKAPIPLDELLEAKLSIDIREMIKKSGRLSNG